GIRLARSDAVRSAGGSLRRPVAPRAPGREPLPDLALATAIRGLVVMSAGELLGQVVLLHDRVVVVVGIEVARAVAETLHERRRGVPQVERDGEDAAPADVLGRGEHGAVGGVRLGTGGEERRGLR